MAERVLVTGAAGFIGSHVVDALLARGDRVLGVDNFDDFYDPAVKRANVADACRSTAFTMVDADVEAVRSATRSVRAAGLDNCRVLPSDVAAAVLGARFDVVVTNPPFHVDKATDLDVPLQFIRDAFDVLTDGGRLFLVANRTLPYERPIYQRFGNIATVVDGRRFKVLMATRSGV